MLKKLTEPFVVGVVSRVLGQVISFVSVAIASRYLDLEVFGTFALAWAATVIGNTFVFTGFYQALLRAPDGEAARDTLFWMNAGVGALGTLVILFFGFLSGGWGSPQGFALLALAPTPFLIVPTAWWEAMLVRAKRVRSASLYVLLAELAGLIAAIVALRHGWQIGALILSRYVSLAVGLALTGGLVCRLPRLRFRRDSAGEASKTAWPLWGTTSVSMFTNYGTDIILGALASATMIGAYRGGARIAMTATDLVLQPLGVLTWSKFTRIEKENEAPELPLAALRDAWIDNMAIAAAILWPLSATVALLAPELVVTILDATWLPAAGVVAILSVSRAVVFLSVLLEPTMIVTGNGRLQLVVRLWGAGALLVLLLVFARYGAEPAAYAHLASSLLMAAIALVAMLRVLALPVARIVAAFLPGLGLTALISAIIVGARLLVDAESLMGLVAVLASVSVAWLTAMVLLLKRRVLELPSP